MPFTFDFPTIPVFGVINPQSIIFMCFWTSDPSSWLFWNVITSFLSFFGAVFKKWKLGYPSKVKNLRHFYMPKIAIYSKSKLEVINRTLVAIRISYPRRPPPVRRASKRDKENRHNSISCPEPNFKVLFFGVPSKFLAVYLVFHISSPYITDKMLDCSHI
jgi:hypothetical protein